MHVIDVDFKRLCDTPLGRLLGMMGVYVLWDSQAKARPSYIGEGNILKRLVVEHIDRFAWPIDGYAAIVHQSSWQRAKADAEIVEALLLEVSKRTDRAPSTNVAPGKLRALDSIFRAHGTLRVNVRGFDPLMPPETAPPLSTTKQIVLQDVSDDLVTIDHDWRWRRRQQA